VVRNRVLGRKVLAVLADVSSSQEDAAAAKVLERSKDRYLGPLRLFVAGQHRRRSRGRRLEKFWMNLNGSFFIAKRQPEDGCRARVMIDSCLDGE
jgi:hypothetical protein